MCHSNPAYWQNAWEETPLGGGGDAVGGHRRGCIDPATARCPMVMAGLPVDTQRCLVKRDFRDGYVRIRNGQRHRRVHGGLTPPGRTFLRAGAGGHSSWSTDAVRSGGGCALGLRAGL